jgi:uncharacterized membrane protein (DUF373 family)
VTDADRRGFEENRLTGRDGETLKSPPGSRLAEALSGGGSGLRRRRFLGVTPGDQLVIGLRVLQVLIAVALFIVAGVVLVRTVADFVGSPSHYPDSIVSALDGLLVVIIIVDLLHTVVTSVREASFPLRPFLIIGILAAVRDVLSASARLTLPGHTAGPAFTHAVVELSVAVGVVVVLLGGLVVLRLARNPGEKDVGA